VNIQILGNILLHVPEEPEIFLMAMAMLAASEDGAGGDIEGGEERRGAMPDIVVGKPLDIAQSHRQHRLSTVQGLDLALLVHAQDHGFIGRIEV